MVVHCDVINAEPLERFYIVYTQDGRGMISEQPTKDDAATYVENLVNHLGLDPLTIWVIQGKERCHKNAMDKYKVAWR